MGKNCRDFGIFGIPKKWNLHVVNAVLGSDLK
jgi:hypothetical protein